MKILMVAAVACFPFAANASQSIYEDCLSALQRGDKEAARDLAETITRFNQFPADSFDAAEACVEKALDGAYVYRRGEFVTRQRAAEMDRAADAADQRLRAEAAARKAREKELQELREKAKASRALNRARVMREFIAACADLYKAAPQEAILKDSCRSVFLEVGLPD